MTNVSDITADTDDEEKVPRWAVWIIVGAIGMLLLIASRIDAVETSAGQRIDYLERRLAVIDAYRAGQEARPGVA
jgi:hypothetical protein